MPGRLCVLGEHSDWAANYRESNPHIAFGMTIVCATNEGLYARCGTFEPMTVKFVTPAAEEKVFFIDDHESIKSVAESGQFFSYVAGALLSILRWNTEFADLLKKEGMCINNYRSTLPMKKGLSSSAAVCVLVVSCFSKVFDQNLCTNDVMEIAYRGEMFTPSQCGRMDQCVAMGKDTIGLMIFTNSFTKILPLSPTEPLFFVVADLKGKKDTLKILNSLNSCFAVPKCKLEYSMHEYVRQNQDIAWNAIAAIEMGNTRLLAKSMSDAQNSFDKNLYDICPQEFLSPTLRSIFSDSNLTSNQFYIATKGVGSNGDGSVQFLCENSEKQEQLRAILNSEAYNLDAFSLTIPMRKNFDQSKSLHSRRIVGALMIVKVDESEKEIAYAKTFIKDLLSCGVRRISLLFVSKHSLTAYTRGDFEAVCTKENIWSYERELHNLACSAIVELSNHILSDSETLKEIVRSSISSIASEGLSVHNVLICKSESNPNSSIPHCDIFTRISELTFHNILPRKDCSHVMSSDLKLVFNCNVVRDEGYFCRS